MNSGPLKCSICAWSELDQDQQAFYEKVQKKGKKVHAL